MENRKAAPMVALKPPDRIKHEGSQVAPSGRKPEKGQSPTGSRAPAASAIVLPAEKSPKAAQSALADEAERIREALLSLQELALAEGGDAWQAPLAGVLAGVPGDIFRAEAERRGLLKPPSSNRAPSNRGAISREKCALMTRQAWSRARELAKEKGGKPQDHMKQAWSDLPRG